MALKLSKQYDTFSLEKMNEKIHEYRMNCGHAKEEDKINFYPYIHVYRGDDISKFTKARHDVSDVGKHLGWLFNEDEESFKQSCNVIAEKFGAKPELVEVALWLLDVYYMDGEYDIGNVYCFERANKHYGLRDEDTFNFMKWKYADFRIENVAEVAKMLDN